jgi:excisionase family DNA binding protein
MDAPNTQLFSVAETAGKLRISRAMVFKLVRQGKLRPVRIGTRTLFAGSELERFIAEASTVAA